MHILEAMGFLRPAHAKIVVAGALALGVAPWASLAASQNAKDDVNYDDPNMAITNEFAGDAATSCPSDMDANDLAKCLREKGLVTPTDLALARPLPTPPKTR